MDCEFQLSETREEAECGSGERRGRHGSRALPFSAALVNAREGLTCSSAPVEVSRERCSSDSLDVLSGHLGRARKAGLELTLGQG